MKLNSEKTTKSVKMMFLAGGLFFLSGAIWLAIGLDSHNAVWISIGGMFLAIGGMWIAIGASFQTKEASDTATRRM